MTTEMLEQPGQPSLTSETTPQRLTFPTQNWLKPAPALLEALTGWSAHQKTAGTESPTSADEANTRGQENLDGLRQLAGFDQLLQEIRRGYREFGAVVVSGLPTGAAAPLSTGLGAGVLEFKPEYGLIPKLLTITTDEMAQYQAAAPGLFELHDDFAFAATPPDTTFILCIQPDPQYPVFGLSYLLDSARLIPALKAQRPHLLDFALNTPVTFTSDHSLQKTAYTGHLIEPDPDGGGYELRYRRRFLSPEFVQAHAALLSEYEDFTQSLAMEFVLDRGDLLIFNNRRFLHGRGPCTLKYTPDGAIISRQVMSIWGKTLLNR